MISATMRPETLMRTSKVSTSRPVRRSTRSGQGIIEANRKTEICRHWLTGACPFGAKCAFAHGAHELRAPSVDTERTSRGGMGGAKMLQFQTKPDGEVIASCCNHRCTMHTNGPLLCVRNSQLLQRCNTPSANVYRNENSMGLHHAGCPPTVSSGGNNAYKNNASSPPDTKCSCCTRQEVQKQGRVNEGGNTGSFSLWESPMAMTSANLGQGYHFNAAKSRADTTSRNTYPFAKMENTVPVSRGVAFSPASSESTLQATLRENETWAKIVRRGYGEDQAIRSTSCLCEDSRDYPKDSCFHCNTSAAHSENASAPSNRFSLFHEQRSITPPPSVSVIRDSSSCGKSSSVATDFAPTADAAAGWDPSILLRTPPYSRSNNPREFGAAASKKESSTSAHFGTSGLSKVDEDDSLARIMPSFLFESSKSEAGNETDRVQWCPLPPLLTKGFDAKNRHSGPLDSTLSPYRAPFNTSLHSTSTTASTVTQTSNREAGTLNSPWHPLRHGYQKSSLSNEDGVFKVISSNIPSTSPKSSFAWSVTPSTKGLNAPGSTSAFC